MLRFTDNYKYNVSDGQEVASRPHHAPEICSKRRQARALVRSGSHRMTGGHGAVAPEVTIAIPVYNGENYLSRALASVAAQTFTDYEVIISDNASTDGTAAICLAAAENDPRIRYSRNEQNIGVNPNFERCVHEARGRYLCWLAHDDELKPDYVERCHRILSADDDIVLVHSLVEIIDKNSETFSLYDSGLDGSDSDDPVRRFRALTHVRHTCTAIFGLFRLDALKRTALFSSNHHAVDRSLLAEISLIGKIVQIDEPLFRNREHRERYVRSVRPSERSSFHQRQEKGRVEISQLMLRDDYRRAIERHVDDGTVRRRCYGVLKSWWFVEWNLVRLLVEMSATHAPWVYDAAKWVSDRVIQPKYPTITKDKRLR